MSAVGVGEGLDVAPVSVVRLVVEPAAAVVGRVGGVHVGHGRAPLVHGAEHLREAGGLVQDVVATVVLVEAHHHHHHDGVGRHQPAQGLGK